MNSERGQIDFASVFHRTYLALFFPLIFARSHFECFIILHKTALLILRTGVVPLRDSYYLPCFS